MTPDPEFKVGDRVRIRKPGGEWAGTECVVLDVYLGTCDDGSSKGPFKWSRPHRYFVDCGPGIGQQCLDEEALERPN